MRSTKNGLPPEYYIDQMTHAEASLLMSWAAAEGWNPGTADLEVAWGYDPDAFIALRRRPEGAGGVDELVGGGAILSYAGKAGFMGLFIMRSDHRRRGLGRVLWHERLSRLRARLQPTAWIGMDGVLEMAPFYAAGGFDYLYRDVRYEGIAPSRTAAATYPSALRVVPVSDVPFDQLHSYDESIFGVSRGEFLRRWTAARGVKTCAALRASEHGDEALVGYAVRRPCQVGYKLGPVFADDAAVARALVHELIAGCSGEQIQIDVPELNGAAVEIATSHGWAPTFACARMAYGQAPLSAHAKAFGVTSFEFG
jgi:hypothetical protein